MTPEPHHDCPPCPSCGARCSTPARHSPDWTRYVKHPYASFDDVARSDLWCPPCGHGWIEADPARVEQAWAAWHAWERKERRDAKR